ncbi:regulator [Gordonia desulfuricans]|uniref:Regulator n=1 Tax=Gordonia desulfuricans TaxID=89051 RepID=A0A7K3LLD1_9ACTN|nr:PaaX family transcriptional regulator C-terminal domain-containing protein [Gordonia desulfuricans]NDK89060.1 regulator [Gordonia desulfuricans]
MEKIVDEFDSRPGSATSLLRTVLGVTVGNDPTHLSTSSIVTLMGAVGVADQPARTALTRLKAKGHLVAQPDGPTPGYVASDRAARVFARDILRYVRPRLMTDGDPWCLISFSVPEQDRGLRHQLRRRLTWMGCGNVANGLWICPAYMDDEVHEMVAELGLTGHVTTFIVSEIHGETRPDVAVTRWWDFELARDLHDHFLAAHAAAMAAYSQSPDPRTAFHGWTRALDLWRPITYVDPALPSSMMSADWPGTVSVPKFLELSDSLEQPAGRFIEEVTGRRSAMSAFREELPR